MSTTKIKKVSDISNDHVLNQTNWAHTFRNKLAKMRKPGTQFGKTASQIHVASRIVVHC